jgi:hypothetical protein
MEYPRRKKKHRATNQFNKYRQSKRKTIGYGTRVEKHTFAWILLHFWLGVLCGV